MFKNILIAVFWLIFVFNSISQVDKSKSEMDTTITVQVDQPAVFPGGETAMFNFLKSNLKFPNTAKENDISGKCFIQFVVTK